MREAKVFPLSSGGHLEVSKSLLETLYIDYQLLAQSCWERDRHVLRAFVQGAEDAWATARHRVLRSEINLISWLRGLLTEAHRSKIWIPPIFIKRLRQLERSELVLHVRGTQVHLPRDEGLPSEYLQCRHLCKWRWTLVPNIEKGCYLNPFDRSPDSSERWSRFVQDVVEIWRNRPQRGSSRNLRKWVVSELRKKDWSIS
jgi:hypothetical protein